MMKKRYALTTLGTSLGLLLVVTAGTNRALAHKVKHTPEQLKAFEEVFMEQVRVGDLLFHGDEATQKQFGVTLSKTGMACAMCHPFASDTHPYEFPKFQEQMNKFGTLRDMINWCIEKPNEGEKIDPDSEAMKALEAYIYWSNRGSKLDPGRH
ncbi:MAG: c-type cytochrome [Candidatus Methylomirabilales bacterium]